MARLLQTRAFFGQTLSRYDTFKVLFIVKSIIGSGMDIPNWEIFGATMVSSQQIRLTADVQSRKGAVWNRLVNFNFFIYKNYSF